MIDALNQPPVVHEGLQIVQCGIEKCLPSHAFGPAVRDHYLIHYIFSGHGSFQTKDEKYGLHEGQGFLICPDQITYYQADAADPWHYIWIGFSGPEAVKLLLAAGLDMLHPIIEQTAGSRIGTIFREMAEALAREKGKPLRLAGLLYLFIAEMHESAAQTAPAAGRISRQDSYIRQAIEMMGANYSRKITISSLARQIGLDRSYFGLLFKQQTGRNPKQYLLDLRVEKACELLKRSFLPIAAIARSVGYEDPLLFSRMFHLCKGCSPTAYRKMLASVQTPA
jgi:AraC-like DNA-binding protein